MLLRWSAAHATAWCRTALRCNGEHSATSQCCALRKILSLAHVQSQVYDGAVLTTSIASIYGSKRGVHGTLIANPYHHANKAWLAIQHATRLPACTLQSALILQIAGVHQEKMNSSRFHYASAFNSGTPRPWQAAPPRYVDENEAQLPRVCVLSSLHSVNSQPPPL